MSKVLDLSWMDVYKDVQEGYISWEEFDEYLRNLTNQAYKNGYDDCTDDVIGGKND